MGDKAQALDAEEQLVVFELANEVYGVDISRVQEIIRMTTITRLPRAPEFVEGVINLRGKVIPVVDLKKRFGLQEGERTKASRIVVVDVGDHTIGMVVDAVSEVLRVPSGAVEPPSPVVTTIESDYIRGIAKLEGRLIILLDLDKVLSWDEKRKLREAVAA
ncbi:MAG: chemotaxis protein CheW [Actinobacteria bacterium]|nr:chemotaxis protein CheW [Actinomycetota bacterium]